MKRHLFLTGPMGCGKSTAILTAVGSALPRFGGFLTKRVRDEQDSARCFYLTSPDGAKQAVFLDCAGPKPQVDLSVFDTLGVELLNQEIATPVCELARNDIYILDEIGGVELLCPAFMEALGKLLSSDVPVLGVLKGEGPASVMVTHLGLTEEYETAAQALRKSLQEDENTLLYECGQFDEQALRLAQGWVKEYADA